MRRNSSLIPIICIVIIFLGGMCLEYCVINVLSYSEIDSPSNRIKSNDIIFYPDKVVINISQAWGTSYTDTQSMDPTIDAGMHGVVIKPKDISDIVVGDVLSYKMNGQLIAHRVIEINEDSDGWFARCKGDNNIDKDPWKIRWENVNGVLVALVY